MQDLFNFSMPYNPNPNPNPVSKGAPVLAAPTRSGGKSSAGFFDQVNTGLLGAVNIWGQVEAIKAQKNLSGQGQRDHLNTTQAVNPPVQATPPNPAAALKDKMAQGLKIGTGTLAAVVGGVVVLFWLSRRK